jgi:acyl transferase domain-containing protein
VVTGTASKAARPALVCTGHAAGQLPAIRALYRVLPRFAGELAELWAHVGPGTESPLTDVIEAGAAPAGQAALDQAALAEALSFAAAVAFSRCLRHWGAVPGVIVASPGGHLAAACAAGMITVGDAAALLARRREGEQGNHFGQACRDVPFGQARIRTISTAAGEIADTTMLTSAAFWNGDDKDQKPITQILQELAAETTASLIPLGVDGAACTVAALIERLATAHVNGVTIGWQDMLTGPRSPGLELPTYAFQREHFALPS